MIRDLDQTLVAGQTVATPADEAEATTYRAMTEL
jgi:hypothetical protein